MNSRVKTAWLFLAPMVLLMLVVAVWPLARSIWFSFTDININDISAAEFVGWENVVEKRAPYRQAHLEGLNQQKERGILVTIGPTADLSQVFAIYQAASESEVRELIESDPYWQNGIWTEYQVKEWIQAI